MNPLLEKLFIGIAVLLGIWGLIYLLSAFPTQGILFVTAAIVGTIFVGGLVWFFTRHPA